MTAHYTDIRMSYAQIGDEALLQADYRKGEDPLAKFEAVTALASVKTEAMAQNSWNRIWIDAWSLGFKPTPLSRFVPERSQLVARLQPQRCTEWSTKRSKPA